MVGIRHRGAGAFSSAAPGRDRESADVMSHHSAGPAVNRALPPCPVSDTPSASRICAVLQSRDGRGSSETMSREGAAMVPECCRTSRHSRGCDSSRAGWWMSRLPVPRPPSLDAATRARSEYLRSAPARSTAAMPILSSPRPQERRTCRSSFRACRPAPSSRLCAWRQQTPGASSTARRSQRRRIGWCGAIAMRACRCWCSRSIHRCASSARSPHARAFPYVSWVRLPTGIIASAPRRIQWPDGQAFNRSLPAT